MIIFEIPVDFFLLCVATGANEPWVLISVSFSRVAPAAGGSFLVS